jgi:predicted secreted protein
MAKITGKSVVFAYSTDSGSTWKSIICEISNTFNFERAFDSQETKCDGGTVSKVPGAYDWSIDVSGVADNAPSGTQASYEEILALAVAGTEVLGRLQSPSSGSVGADFYKAGNMFVSSLSATEEVNGAYQFDMTLQGNGALDIAP